MKRAADISSLNYLKNRLLRHAIIKQLPKAHIKTCGKNIVNVRHTSGLKMARVISKILGALCGSRQKRLRVQENPNEYQKKGKRLPTQADVGVWE
jgi:hypothetical protein